MNTTATHHVRPVPGGRPTPTAGTVTFVLGGEGLASAMGYEVGDAQPPWAVAIAATVPALVVFVLPAVLAAHFGRQAVRLGDRRRWGSC